MARMQKIAKIINVVLRITWWVISLCILIWGIAVVESVLHAAPNLNLGIAADPNFFLETVLKIGNFKLSLTDGYLFLPDNGWGVLKCIGYTVILALLWYELTILKNVFRPMEQGLPFDGTVSAAIRKVAWIKLIEWVLGVAVCNADHYFLYQALDMPTLFSPDRVSACTVAPNYYVEDLVVFALLMLLSYVFRYGEELQKLSDETL